MRHKKKFNHLGRTASHRNAMLANMASSLIIHKRIKTTVAKAKALRLYVEPLITRSKSDTTHSRRMVFRKLKDKYAVTELFREISTKIAERNGGYTRILKTGNRLGDNAEMCIIELVDYNENMATKTKAPVKKTTRRRSKKKVEDTAVVDAPKAETKEVSEKETKETPKVVKKASTEAKAKPAPKKEAKPAAKKEAKEKKEDK
ncbi:MAG: 50S ribosomal protein L17 [Chlamydiia bacterium]|nr:50S ribosomal protein L17 [Chlamydiia bacterium]